MTLPRFLSPKAAGEVLGLSAYTVREMIRDGRLPRAGGFPKGRGKPVRVPLQAVLDYAEGRDVLQESSRVEHPPMALISETSGNPA